MSYERTYDDRMFIIDQCAVSLDKDALMLNLTITNTAEAEVLYQLGNAAVNGAAVEAAAEIYGSGENWGLVKGETVNAMVAINLPGAADLTTVTFDLACINAATNETLDTVSVTMHPSLQSE